MAERRGDRAAVGQVGFGELLRACRERELLSQERLAERSGLSARTVRDLEVGRVRRPHAESVRLLADALHLAGWERGQFQVAARGSPAAGPPRAQPLTSAPGNGTSCQLTPGVGDLAGRSRRPARPAGQPRRSSSRTEASPDGLRLGAPMAESAATIPPAAAGRERDVLLATKLHVPRPRAGFVPRPRLLARLGEGKEREAVLAACRRRAGRDATRGRRTGRRAAWSAAAVL
jgi:transcriptional regulator with XRE-family HTH domain